LDILNRLADNQRINLRPDPPLVKRLTSKDIVQAGRLGVTAGSDLLQIKVEIRRELIFREKIVELSQFISGCHANVTTIGGDGPARTVDVRHLPARPIGGRTHGDRADAVAKGMTAQFEQHHSLEVGGSLQSPVHASGNLLPAINCKTLENGPQLAQPTPELGLYHEAVEQVRIDIAAGQDGDHDLARDVDLARHQRRETYCATRLHHELEIVEGKGHRSCDLLI